MSIEIGRFFFTKSMANDDFSEPPRRADSKKPIFFFPRFLRLGHLRGPGVSLGRILGVLSIEPFFGGGAPAGGLYQPPPPPPGNENPASQGTEVVTVRSSGVIRRPGSCSGVGSTCWSGHMPRAANRSPFRVIRDLCVTGVIDSVVPGVSASSTLCVAKNTPRRPSRREGSAWAFGPFPAVSPTFHFVPFTMCPPVAGLCLGARRGRNGAKKHCLGVPLGSGANSRVIAVATLIRRPISCGGLPDPSFQRIGG